MKYNTQNAKIASIKEETLVLGIDVGSETHYVRAFDWRNYEFSDKPLAFSNDEAGFLTFMAWVEDIKEKAGKTAVIPGMEPTGHYWFNLGKFLQDSGMRPVHVNPHHVKKSKEMDDNNPDKNDRKDPKTIAALVNEGRFSYPYIPTGVYAEIRSLSNLRFQTQEEITRIRNRIARWISIYFPEYKDVYGELDAVSGMMVLQEAPLPMKIKELGAEGINQIWRKGETFIADETYIKVRGIKTYVWLIMNAACRSIIGYQVSDNRGVGPCILAMRMAFRGLKTLPEHFQFIADGYSAYPLAAMEFARKFDKNFTFQITQVLGLTNDDAVSKEYRPFKQIVERLNRTYKASYRKTNGFDNIEGANYDLALWVAYYNFLRPHKRNNYKVLNDVEMLHNADNMPGKWQLLIFLGQQTILNMQKNNASAQERSCCQ